MEDPAADDLADLNSAISQLSKEVLESLVTFLVKTNAPAREIVRRCLFVDKNKVSVPRTDSSASDAASNGDDDDNNEDEEDYIPLNETTAPKRLMTRYAVCEMCDKEFDVSENTPTSCRYHPVSARPDMDFFVDHDDYHVSLDDPELQEEFPEGYVYECCGRNGTEEPCTRAWHFEANLKGIKRRKL